MALSDVYDYFADYDSKSFWVVACQGHEPSEEHVAEFERRVGFRLPEEFREFTKSPCGGMYIEVQKDIWPRARPLDVGASWSFHYGIKVFGIAHGIPPWLDIRVQFQSFAHHQPAMVPFLQVQGDADCYCFLGSGDVVRWDHETGELEPVRATFSELLMREIRELEQRKEKKLAEARPA